MKEGGCLFPHAFDLTIDRLIILYSAGNKTSSKTERVLISTCWPLKTRLLFKGLEFETLDGIEKPPHLLEEVFRRRRKHQ
jgi:hypothetical protein